MNEHTSVPATPAPPPYGGVPPVYPPSYSVPPRPPKPLFPLSKGDTAFAVTAVAVCILWSSLGWFGGMALGYLISVVAVMLLLGIYLKKGGRLTAFSLLCGVLALGLGAVFLCTTNGSVRFYATVVSFLLGLCCFHSMTVGATKGNRQTAGIFYSAAATTANIGVAVKSLFSNEKGEKRAIGKALLGLTCSLPVLVIILPLLISSDDAFRGMMNTLFNDGNTLFVKCLFGIGMAFLVVAYGLSLKHRRTIALGESKFPGIEGVYILSFLSVISVIYVMYLFSQLAYFFSAFRGFLPEGDITVAQYARTGFFEMSAIAAINLALVIGAMLLAKKKNGKVGHPIKAVCSFISLFTLMIIATALSKMVLYIDSFGMTELRLTTSAFMVFLAVVFLATILRIYWRPINVVKTALLTAGVLLVILGVGNVNALCARYNYEAWQSGALEEIDAEALYHLGPEGIPYLVKLADSPDLNASGSAQYYLSLAYELRYFEYEGDQPPRTVPLLKQAEETPSFSYYSIPRAEAYRCLYQFYETHPDFIEYYWPSEPDDPWEDDHSDESDDDYAWDSDTDYDE